jgi:DNA-binding MarR family transcriptional regulator
MAKRASEVAKNRLQVADAVHSSSLRLLRLLRLQDAASGIGPARLSALSVLVFAGPCSLKQLAGYEQVKPPTMSRIVEALRRSGLVKIEPAADDRRRMIIVPTPRGKQVMWAGRQRRVRYLAERLAACSPAELSSLKTSAAIIFRLLTPNRSKLL